MPRFPAFLFASAEGVTMSKRYWDIKAKAETCEIYLFEMIGKDYFSDEGITAKQFQSDLKALGPVSQIDLHVNSPGGNVWDGIGIYNILKSHKAEKRGFVDGVAASIASAILCACDHVTVYENSLCMLHNPAGLCCGQASEMLKVAEALNKVKSSLISIYRDKTGMSEQQISEIMDEETWWDGYEAKRHGLADFVEAPVSMAASIDLSSFKNFKNIPARLLPGNKGDTMEEKTQHERVYKKDLHLEKERVAACLAIGKEFKCEDVANQAILEDWSEDQLREKVLSQIKNKKSEPVTLFMGSSGEVKKGLIPARSPKYFDLFRGANYQEAKESWGDFLKRVTLDIRNETHMEKIPSSGGFSVPVQYAATLLDESLEDEICRPRATIWPMTTSALSIPAWDSATHTSNLFGGFAATWTGEGSTAIDQKGKLRLMTLTAKKLGIWTAASSELIADGLNFEVSLTDAIKKALSWFLDYAFLQGIGAGEPVGVLNSPSLIVQTKETGQLSSTIVYENLANMYARLHSSCHKRAVWLCNSSAIPQLLQISLALGAAGTHFPVLRETDGRFFIFGKEVLFTEKLPALGSQGDIVLVDLSQYMIGMRSDVFLERSNAPGWHTDTLSYRILLRADGQGSWDKVITPKAGSTLSWVVTLQAR